MDNGDGYSMTGEAHFLKPHFVHMLAILAIGLGLAYAFMAALHPTPVGLAQGLATQAAEPTQGDLSHNPDITATEQAHSPAITDTINAPTAGDLSVVKSHTVPFIQGNQGVYSFQVQNVNLSDSVVGPITLTDNLPNGFTLFGSFGNGWNTCTGIGTVTARCVYSNTSNLTPGSVLPTLNITVTVGKLNASTITNTVTITNPGDVITDNNTDKDPITLNADLAVTKSVAPSNPSHLGVVTYTVMVVNNGPEAAPNVVLTDTLPANLTNNGYTKTVGSGAFVPSTGRWTIGNMDVGASEILTVAAKVDPSACGLVTNTTNGLTSNLIDPVQANNSDSASFTATNTCIIGHVKDADTLLPINLATVALWKSSAYHYFDTQTDSSGVYTFTDTSSQIISNSVTITGTKTGYIPDSISFGVISGTVNFAPDLFLTPAVDLEVSKSDGRTSVVPGQTFTYTISITNSGFTTATAVVVSDTWSSDLIYLTDSLSGQSDVISRTVDHTRIWTLTLGLDPGEHSVLSLRSQVASTLGSNTVAITNTVRVFAPNEQEDESNNLARDVDYTPNVSIVKSVSPTQASANSRFAFTITIQNNSKADMTSVTLSDIFPSYLTYYSASTTRGTYGYNTSTRTFTASIGTMVPNEVVTITINMTVNTTVSSTQTLYNYASVVYTFGGTSLTQNSNSVSYRVIGSTSLPGTGWGPIQPTQDRPRSMAGFLAAAFSGLVLFAGGLLALVYGLRSRKRQQEWAGWSLQLGGLLVVVGLLFGAVAWGLGGFSLNLFAAQVQEVATSASPTATQPVVEPAATAVASLYTFQDYETLPDYPVPTPDVAQDAGNGLPTDESAPVRLLIPTLGLDTVIKYVPFDGFSWLISGLQNEIAWMGDTSWPGLGSNTTLAGHVTLRNGANGPFRYLETLQPGDIITVFTEENVYNYKVRELKTVDDSDMSVVKPSDNPMITLITCTGWDVELGHYIKRLIVLADLDTTTPIVVRGN